MIWIIVIALYPATLAWAWVLGYDRARSEFLDDAWRRLRK